MARSAAKSRRPRRTCAAATLNLLLGGGDDAGAFFAERSLDALFVFEALLLDLGAELLHLIAEPGELGLDSAEAGLRVGGSFARGLEIVAQGLGALANDFGHEPAERDGDGEEDDGEVDPEQKVIVVSTLRCRMRASDCTIGRMQEGLLLLFL